MNSKDIKKENKLALKAIHESLNLYDIKRKITNCQKQLEKIRKEKIKNIGFISGRIIYEATNVISTRK